MSIEKTYASLESLEAFEQSAREDVMALFYFSHEACNVCKVLKPKVAQLVAEHFPEVALRYADTQLHPEIAAQNRVFTVPTLLLYVDGRESRRWSRSIGLDELGQAIDRPYGMIFGPED